MRIVTYWGHCRLAGVFYARRRPFEWGQASEVALAAPEQRTRRARLCAI